MSAAFMSNSKVSSVLLLRKLSNSYFRVGAPTTHIRTQVQSRSYNRLPHFLRKVKEYDLSPSLFSSAFRSSSSSSASTGAKEVGFVGWYLGMVKCRPIFTKSVTCALIYIAADLSSQTIAKEWTDSYDVLRTLRMAGYGMLILGPTLHFWFNFMSKLFPNRDLLSTLKKMAMGQGVYGPVMTVVFFSTNAFLQGENSVEIVARLKRDLLPTLLNGVMYWPICDFITFKFVPVHLQPLDCAESVCSVRYRLPRCEIFSAQSFAGEFNW